MAELVIATCSSHAPMMAASRESAPEAQREAFFGALGHVRQEFADRGVTAIVIVSNEHFTNFFYEQIPQLCVGVAPRHFGPVEPWLGIEQRYRPGHAELAEHVVRGLLDGGVDASFSHELRLDHGVVSVVDELTRGHDLPLVPIIQNCAVAPMAPLRRCMHVGAALGEAIRSAPTDDRVALIGAGGLSHWVGHPRTGDIDDEFDRWFLDHLCTGDLEPILSLTDEQLEQAGNGAHEIRSWLTVAAAAGGTARMLAYEAIHPWITGMGVVDVDTNPAR
jgi:aromatic ring-opening dioxygenase catalytic subunit (LigB family)